jgi:putative colanic acid biosynthesis acetyltransferase WcaF
MRAPNCDPYLAPAFSLRNRLLRFAWGIVHASLFRPSPRPMHAWRSFLLRSFGATLGQGCHVYPGARIWAPWNLRCGDVVAIADRATIYNPSYVVLGTHVTISQEAYLCGATHDYEVPEFPLVSSEISIGAFAWVCARATVQSGVSMGDGAVLALGAVATRNLDAWSVYAGIPARKIKSRILKGKQNAPTCQNG